jgi:competence protein ComEA
MERHRRFMLWLVALALILPLLLKGHGSPEKPGAVAFLPYTARGITVRLEGEWSAPGVYKFPDGSRLSTVTKLAVLLPADYAVERGGVDRPLHNGDILQVVSTPSKHVRIIIKKMRAPERMTLGIPLDPNRMDRDDWDALPGIGPRLAERIINDRQINGDFKTIDDLLRVSGIGEGKLGKIKSLF